MIFSVVRKHRQAYEETTVLFFTVNNMTRMQIELISSTIIRFFITFKEQAVNPCVMFHGGSDTPSFSA